MPNVTSSSPASCIAWPQVGLVLGVEQQEAAAPGADELAAERAGVQRRR